MKAKQHTPINPMGVATKSEYTADKLEMSAPSTKAKKLDCGSCMVDGPYGGKKKQS